MISCMNHQDVFANLFESQWIYDPIATATIGGKMHQAVVYGRQVNACDKRLTSPFVQALVAAQQRNFELEGLLYEAQTKIGCAAKHRKSAQKQLDAQEQDFEKLGQRLKVLALSLSL